MCSSCAYIAAVLVCRFGWKYYSIPLGAHPSSVFSSLPQLVTRRRTGNTPDRSPGTRVWTFSLGMAKPMERVRPVAALVTHGARPANREIF